MAKQRFKNWKKPIIKEGKLTKWNWMVQGLSGLKLGKETDIGAFTYINAQAGVEIGDRVEIGGGCHIYSVSTIDGKRGRVVLEEGCRIGAHSVVLPGVRVGRNTTVGACSLVTKNLPPNVIAFGCPAKIVSKLK
ncbi:MAG: acyltransferase [Candidatus Yanofskybacteria bacterium]|nr:acyltransferase [Candidatus Yanofskybacteria bacterium]